MAAIREVWFHPHDVTANNSSLLITRVEQHENSPILNLSHFAIVAGTGFSLKKFESFRILSAFLGLGLSKLGLR